MFHVNVFAINLSTKINIYLTTHYSVGVHHISQSIVASNVSLALYYACESNLVFRAFIYLAI